MAAFIILGVLAAFGAFCILWGIFGFLLSGNRGGAMVCLCTDGETEGSVIRRFLWLHSTGLCRCPVVLVDCGLSPTVLQKLQRSEAPITLCAPEELEILLKQERSRLDRTGT